MLVFRTFKSVLSSLLFGRRNSRRYALGRFAGDSLARTKNSNSNNHRGRLDIIADILDASASGVRKTYLMYHCNLSFIQMKGYSHFLLNKGLMRMISENGNGGSRLLEATDKGKEFLKAYRGLKALMK